MATYYNTSFVGHYPVGTCAIIVTTGSSRRAAELLNNELEKQGLPPTAKADDMVVVPAHESKDRVIIVDDGNY